MITTTNPQPHICAAEQTTAAQLGAKFFRHRGWLPVFILAIPLLVPGMESAGLWGLGLLLIICGEMWRLAGVAAAGTTTRRRSRNVQKLVTYGAFAWSRNPLYNGNLLIWIGFAVISGVLWFVPVALVAFAIEYSFIVRYEEGVLESTFGDEYLRYKSETPRWFPRPPHTHLAGEHRWSEAWRSEISTFLQYAILLIAFAIKMTLVY